MEFLVDPETGAVRLDFKMNPRQKLLLALATEKVSGELVLSADAEEIIRAFTEPTFPRRPSPSSDPEA